MGLRVTEIDDPTEAYARANGFLLTRPVDHNLLLTILDQSREFSLGGRFWVVGDGETTVGFALESPIGMGAVLSPMPSRASQLLAESVTAPLSRVTGVAAAAAAFAGRWTECQSTAVSDIEAMRLYELIDMKPAGTVSGRFRLANSSDRSTLIEWTDAFVAEADVVPQNAAELVDRRLESGQFWVWDDHGVVSMVSASEPAADVTRVQYVYTPPARRGSGYASACVGQLSEEMTDRGLRCVLYTDLANPTSNSIYRRIGYEAVAEILAYDFA